MRHNIIKTAIAAAAVCAALGSNAAERVWNGVLRINPQAALRLVLHIDEGSGGPEATLDSPDQGAYGIPCELRHLSRDSVSVAAPSLRLEYSGRMDDKGIRGTFKQGFMTLPLDMAPTVEDRKTEPQAADSGDVPYTTEEVSVLNPAASVRLAGTLTVPEGAGPATPVVVMVTGSGLQDRDETVFGHKPFAVIADHLARNGVASLRYDDRGFGQSTGNGETATTADNTSDAQAALSWVRALGRFGKCGVLGHSEGGRIAFGLAAAGLPDFVVALGAPAVRGDSLLADQNKLALQLAAMPAEVAARYSEALLAVLGAYTEGGREQALDEAETMCADWPAGAPYQQLRQNLGLVCKTMTPWLEYFIADDPSADIAGVRCPALAVYGQNDTQVSPALNAARLSTLSPRIHVKVLPGLNHMLQPCRTGAVQEYATIEQTIAPEALDAITAFVSGR